MNERQLRKQEAVSTSHLALKGGEGPTGPCPVSQLLNGEGLFRDLASMFPVSFHCQKALSTVLYCVPHTQAHAPYCPERLSYSVCSYTGSTQAKDCQELARNAGAGEGKNPSQVGPALLSSGPGGGCVNEKSPERT